MMQRQVKKIADDIAISMEPETEAHIDGPTVAATIVSVVAGGFLTGLLNALGSSAEGASRELATAVSDKLKMVHRRRGKIGAETQDEETAALMQRLKIEASQPAARLRISDTATLESISGSLFEALVSQGVPEPLASLFVKAIETEILKVVSVASQEDTD